jgi:hypothetical protein
MVIFELKLLYYMHCTCHEPWLNHAGSDCCSSAGACHGPTSGAGWQLLERKPTPIWAHAETHCVISNTSLILGRKKTAFDIEWFGYWALLTGPSRREAARMADEQPLIWVKLVTEYWKDGPSDKPWICINGALWHLDAGRWSEDYCQF